MLKRWRSFFSLCLRHFKSGLGDRSIVPVGVVLRFNFSPLLRHCFKKHLIVVGDPLVDALKDGILERIIVILRKHRGSLAHLTQSKLACREQDGIIHQKFLDEEFLHDYGLDGTS